PDPLPVLVNLNILIGDVCVDLRELDVAIPADIKTIKRVEDVFIHMYTDISTTKFLTYKDTVITYGSESMRGWGNGVWGRSDMAALKSFSGGAESYGQGGSMARFTLMSGHLYAVDDYSLRVFDVANA